MNYINGFGIEIRKNYDDNYFLLVDRSNNSHKIWIKKQELKHLQRELNGFFKQEEEQ